MVCLPLMLLVDFGCLIFEFLQNFVLHVACWIKVICFWLLLLLLLLLTAPGSPGDGGI